MLLFLKSTPNARKMESNQQFQSKQLDRVSTDPEKDRCTSIDDDFVAECSSADNSIHTPAPSETSRSSAQRSMWLRSGKRPLEEAIIETERKKLDLMQSMGNGREDRDTTYHFLMSLWEPINRLPADRHENSRDYISGDPKTKRDPKWHQFISNAAFSLRGWKIESRKKRPTLGPIIFPDFQRVTTVLHSKLLVFPLSNIPHFVVGSLSLPYLTH